MAVAMDCNRPRHNPVHGEEVEAGDEKVVERWILRGVDPAMFFHGVSEDVTGRQRLGASLCARPSHAPGGTMNFLSVFLP
jgi:hypothetical protein